MVSDDYCSKSPRLTLLEADLHKMFDVNLVAPLFLARAFTRHWLGLPATISENKAAQGSRKDGVKLNKRIVFIASISGLVNMSPQHQVAYNASKAGLAMASKVNIWLFSICWGADPL